MTDVELSELRELIYTDIHRLLVSVSDGDMILTECPRCGWRTPFFISKVEGIERVTDYIIEQLEAVRRYSRAGL